MHDVFFFFNDHFSCHGENRLEEGKSGFRATN